MTENNQPSMSNFFHGKKVLITGHTGFKGSWFALWLQTMGAKVVGYALPPPTNPSLFITANVANGMTSIEGDVRDFSSLAKVFEKYQPEIVVHMAAQSLVRHSYANPVETYATNVMGTVHLLEAARLAGCVRAIVNVTSDKCYENREWIWGYRENEPMGGYDPYSSSKGCAELVTAAYRNSYFPSTFSNQQSTALASARAGNVIGGGDWAADRLIPDIMRAIVQGKPVQIRNPHATRPWQHVLEPLSGYLVLAERLYTEGLQFAEAWNFGPGDEDARPVRWIIERLAELQQDVKWQCDETLQPHEAHYLKLDSSKAKSRLDWQARWRLQAALQKTMEWHQAWRHGEDMHALTLSKIAQYQAAGEAD